MTPPKDGESVADARSRAGRLFFLLSVLAVVAAIGYFGLRTWWPGSSDADEEAAARRRIAALAQSDSERGSQSSGVVPGGGGSPSAAAGSGQQMPPPGAAPDVKLEEIFRGALTDAPEDATRLVAESKQVVDAIVQAFPAVPDSYEVAARLYFRLGETDEAVALWERALALVPEYVHALRGLGMAAARRGDEEAAVKHLRRALELQPEFHDAQTELGQVLIDGNRLEEAIELLKKNVASDPRAYRGYVLLGMAYSQAEDFEQAKASYEAAIESHPQHANAHFGLARACARLGETELSEQYMARFQELRSGERKLQARDRQEFDDLRTIAIDTAASYAAAAKVCHAFGAMPDAVQLWRRAAALDPQQQDCRQALAWYHLQQGQAGEAIAMLEQLSRLDPQNLRYQLEIARLHASEGQVEAGEQVLREALRTAKEAGPAHVALANYLLQQGIKLDDARDLAQRAVTLDPDPANYVLLALACQRTGRLPEALRAAAQAVQQAPNNPEYQQFYEQLTAQAAESQ